jgi:hypothetical protein
MDVKADQRERQADPFATAVVPQPDVSRQGQLFADAYPTYADTDQIPAAAGGAPTYRRPRTSRLLRLAVGLVALAVLAGGAALGLVKAGVLDTTNDTGHSSATAPPSHHTTTRPAQASAVTQLSTGAATATYLVDAPTYAVTVVTTAGRSWVSIGATGQPPAFSGILAPNSSKKVTLLGPSQVNVGAGGTKVTITTGKRSTTLTPPSAPFTYQFQIKKS